MPTILTDNMPLLYVSLCVVANNICDAGQMSMVRYVKVRSQLYSLPNLYTKINALLLVYLVCKNITIHQEPYRDV